MLAPGLDLDQLHYLSIRIATLTRLIERFQIAAPMAVVIGAQIIEIVPGKNARVMAIAKVDLDGIVAGLGDRIDGY